MESFPNYLLLLYSVILSNFQFQLFCCFNDGTAFSNLISKCGLKTKLKMIVDNYGFKFI